MMSGEMSVVMNVMAWIAAMGSGSALLSLSILSALFSILLAAPALFFFVQTVAARRHRRPEYLPLRAQRVAILMPAHNEEASIERTLTELMAALDEGMTIWVVADNCSDETARLAAELGARVVVRDEPERHGKGYAIERGLRPCRATHLMSSSSLTRIAESTPSASAASPTSHTIRIAQRRQNIPWRQAQAGSSRASAPSPSRCGISYDQGG